MAEKDVLLAIISVIVLMCNIFTTNSVKSVKASDGPFRSPARGQDKASKAYHRLRSCHRVLREESGEFFSPDFLCSNPPLWCNWTILAPPGRRIRLQLQDFTPAESCHSKRDQIHLDESPRSGRHRTLERCWASALYTSDSSTLYVVLLIDGSLEPTYRGFSARYHTFGLPHTTPPLPSPVTPAQADDVGWAGGEEENSIAGREEEKPAVELEQMDSGPTLSSTTDSVPRKETSGTKSPSPEPTSATAPPGQDGSDTVPDPAEVSEMQAGEVTDPEPNPPKMDSAGLLKNGTIVPIEVRVSEASTKGDLEEEELGPVYSPDPSPVTKLPSPPNVTSPAPPLSNDLPKIISSTPPSEFQEPDPDYDAADPGSRSTRKPREDWEQEPSPGRAVKGDRLDPPSSSVEKQGTEITRRKGSTKPPGTRPAPEDGTREKADTVRHLKNSSALASLPGENLLEVSVEVRLVPDPKENWDHLVRLVMSSVQSMMQEELRAHVVPKSTSSVRIKRLSTGVLYIFWLQFGDDLAGLQVRQMLNMALSRLQGRQLNTRGRKDSIAFATSEDINECGTQVALCDVNAECFNRFGSYVCRCKPGYEDKSRLGTGGTVCVAPTETGPAQSQPPSSSLLGCLFGLCFLLGIFVVLLLCIVGVLYRRHHRGAFIVPCHKRQHAGSDSGADRNGSPLPPPPPPIRRPKDGWGNPKEACPSTDLPLLKFAPLVPSDGGSYKGQEEGDNL